MIEQFFTTEQVANILQVHPFTILKFIRERKLPGIKLGRVYRIKESDVRKFLEERSVGETLGTPIKQPVVPAPHVQPENDQHFQVEHEKGEERQYYNI